MKWVFVAVCMLFVAGSFLFTDYDNITELTTKVSGADNQVYQGAVPEGYDLDLYRKTGLTKPLEAKA